MEQNGTVALARAMLKRAMRRISIFCMPYCEHVKGMREVMMGNVRVAVLSDRFYPRLLFRRNQAQVM